MSKPATTKDKGYFEFKSTTHRLELILEEDAWQTLFDKDPQALELIAKAGLLALNQPINQNAKDCAPKSPHHLAVVKFSNDEHIKELNKTYRGKDKPTNVLSFPNSNMDDQEGGVYHIGDAILAYETITNEAKRNKIAIKHHVSHLMIHAILHLLGYDHETQSQAITMEQQEITLMNQLGLNNPYR